MKLPNRISYPGLEPDTLPGLKPDTSGNHPGDKSGKNPGNINERISVLIRVEIRIYPWYQLVNLLTLNSLTN